MFVALGFCSSDVDAALSLLEWIGQLGGVGEYHLLLVADASTDWGKCADCLTVANRHFRAVQVITPPKPIEGWPAGANALWLLAAEQSAIRNEAFLWLEPDALPIKRGWLVAIDKMRGDGFFGHIYDCRQPGISSRVLSGIAVYPPGAFELIAPLIRTFPDRAWDVSSAEVAVPRATTTKLIQHFWGTPQMPPTFVEAKNAESPVNTFTLSDVWPEAVIFHRCKDGSLLRLIRRQLSLAAPGNCVVVLPFCNADVDLLRKNLDWMADLGMPRTHDCLLSYDKTTLRESVRQVHRLASQVFFSVLETSYSVPHGTQFPQTAAWQHAARVLYQMDRNWIWFEPDCVPLRSGWLDVLQSIYNNCKLPFCGPVVPERGHMNGTGIYPANTPELLPRTMSHTNNAWDVEAREEMGQGIKDIGHIWFCSWGVKDGKLNPLEGDPPSFPPGSPLLNQIPRTAVVFHRCKDGSLIDRLMS